MISCATSEHLNYSTSKTQLRDMISQLSPIHAPLIFVRFSEFNEFTEFPLHLEKTLLGPSRLVGSTIGENFFVNQQKPKIERWKKLPLSSEFKITDYRQRHVIWKQSILY